MVVEDDAGIRALYRAILEGTGRRVVEVAGGEKALAAARAAMPDLILLDIGLPGISGLDVLRILKGQPDVAAIPVIVVTAWDDPALVAEALRDGAVDYVRKPFGPDELSARVDVALRTKAQHDALRADAGIDPLTQTANRRALDEALAREHARARRTRRGFSILLVDLDHFKTINDRHGHATGDAVLRAAARRLAGRARAVDISGRWGGEEFLVIAPDTDAVGAAALGEDLRGAVAEAPCAGVAVTTSVGVAAWAREAIEALLARADAALYAAKAAGRDCVRVAPAPTPRLHRVA